jgi:hypothetical protein
MNVFGVYDYREHIGVVAGTAGPKERDFNYNDVFLRICLLLASAAKFYSRIGFFGTLDIRVGLSGCLGARVKDGVRENMYTVAANEFTWEREYVAHELASVWQTLAPDLLHDIAWSLGIKRLDHNGLAANINEYFPPGVSL